METRQLLGWKWFFLIAVRTISKPLYAGLKKFEDNMNQDFRKSQLSIEDLVPLRARTARNATNLVNQLLEPTFTSPDPRINLRQWNENAESMRHEPVNV